MASSSAAAVNGGAGGTPSSADCISADQDMAVFSSSKRPRTNYPAFKRSRHGSGLNSSPLLNAFGSPHQPGAAAGEPGSSPRSQLIELSGELDYQGHILSRVVRDIHVQHEVTLKFIKGTGLILITPFIGATVTLG